jgi:MYXO-CTERM domain-containing protein
MDCTSDPGCETHTDVDANNCGGCNNDCAFANAADSCVDGSCVQGACDSGYMDCTADPGCETHTDVDANNCGGCNNDCAFANAADSCSGGVCQLGACNTNFGNCDTDDSTGCETDLQADVHHCGGCDNDCSFGNAGASCTAGACTIGPCNAGFGNCDSNDANGCETVTNGSDHDHCGDCDTACTDAQYCAAGSCTAKKANDVACAAADECTSGICDTDDKCGKPNGESCTAAEDCRGGACSVSSMCMDAGKCAVDGDCTSDEFCDTSLHECADKLDNGVVIPTVADHDPELTGACTDPVGAAVCSSAVCDSTDNRCGFPNGDGDCDGSNAATVCRSGSCGADDKCGFPNGEGQCTALNAGVVCRSGICSALNHVCAEAVGCAVDSDCTAAQFCDTSTGACTAKLENGTAVPTIASHTPALTSVCTQAVGTAVCASGVCDAVDDKCGYDNGDGSCSEDTAAAVCRSAVCGSDDKCGYPDGEGECTSITAGDVCRTGLCSPASHVCIEPSGCIVDEDCNSSQFCNTVTKLCTPKLDNGSVIPGIAGHDPELDGTCSNDVGAAVCSSGTCDMADDKCGMRNGAGPCTTANAGSICRSGVCGADGMCGFPDGAGSCTSSNAAARCRSGQCDAESGKCGVAPGCSEDSDCEDSQYCDGGSCDETNAETVCRSGACSSDGKCGWNDAEGSCTDSNAQTVCRSGMCANGVCGPAPGCQKDSECSSSQFCNLDKHECAKKKADGKSCKSDNQCKSDSCGAEDKVCNTCIGDSCGKVKLSGGGCSVSSADDSSPSQSLLLIALSAIALALRVRRRQRARV